MSSMANRDLKVWLKVGKTKLRPLLTYEESRLVRFMWMTHGESFGQIYQAHIYGRRAQHVKKHTWAFNENDLFKDLFVRSKPFSLQSLTRLFMSPGISKEQLAACVSLPLSFGCATRVSYDNLERQSESVEHKHLTSVTKALLIKSGLRFYGHNIGISGCYTMADMVVLDHENNPLFIEILSTPATEITTKIERKMKLGDRVPLLFVIPEGTATNDLEHNKASWAEVSMSNKVMGVVGHSEQLGYVIDNKE